MAAAKPLIDGKWSGGKQFFLSARMLFPMNFA
jgi:hypothetical protein